MNKLFLEFHLKDKEKSITYNKELIFVSKLYSRFISNVKIENLRKISIELVDSPEKERLIPTHKLTKVASIYKYFEWEILEKETNEHKRFRIILDLINNAVNGMSLEFNWPVAAFNKAYLEVAESEFKNEYVLLKPKSSKDKKYCASVVASITKDYSLIFVELLDIKKGNQAKKIILIKTIFFEDDLLKIANIIRWASNEELVISNKENEINFRVSVFDEQAELFLTPRINNENYLIDELNLLNPETSIERYTEIIKSRLPSNYSKIIN